MNFFICVIYYCLKYNTKICGNDGTLLLNGLIKNNTTVSLITYTINYIFNIMEQKIENKNGYIFRCVYLLK